MRCLDELWTGYMSIHLHVLFGVFLPLPCNPSFTTVCSRDGGTRSKSCSSSPCTHMLRVKGRTSAPAGSSVAQSKIHTTEEKPLPLPEFSPNHQEGVKCCHCHLTSASHDNCTGTCQFRATTGMTSWTHRTLPGGARSITHCEQIWCAMSLRLFQ